MVCKNLAISLLLAPTFWEHLDSGGKALALRSLYV